MDANKIQVGGNHYRKEYQHWDFVIDTAMPYVLGCATKYVSRWRSKNGIEDLQKSIHYIAKAMERGIVMGIHDKVHVYTFCDQLIPADDKIIKLICNNDFNLAVQFIKELIDELECSPCHVYVDPDCNYTKG